MKKQVAVTMAGLMITAALPSFAATTPTVVQKTITKKDSSKLVSEVKSLLNKKYNADGEVVSSVYEVKVGTKAILDTEELVAEINKLGDNEQLVVTITDKGHAEIGGKIVSKAREKYETSADLSKEASVITEEAKTSQKGIYKVASIVATYNQDVLSIKMTDKAKEGVTATTKTLEVKVGDEKIDLTANPFDKDGKEIDLTKEGVKVDSISKFALKEAQDIPSVKVAEVTVKNTNLEVLSPSDLYDGYRLTVKGNQVAQGKNKTISEISAQDETTKKYNFTVKYVDLDNNAVELTVESTDRAKLDEVKKSLGGQVKVEVVAGDDRYSTAVEIAKKVNATNNIVIVNSNKLVDGLAATPFAKSKNAPILLGTENSIPKVTLDYIKEIIKVNPNAKIYIVGGESAISEVAKKQLETVTKDVVRLAGNDRHQTSVEVAKAMTGYTEAFVVGAKGEADAMSIAAKAAEKNAPIIVNGWDGISNEALILLKQKNIDIIGGVDNVSNSIKSKLEVIDKDTNVTRVEGQTRHETNAEVIKTYYGKLDNVYIAKDGYGNNGMLVDALAAGPLAAGKGPVVLATSDMTKSQDTILKEKLNSSAKVIQIGNGVQLTVIEKIARILGW